MKGDDNLNLMTSIDASYGTHENGKSQRGLIIMAGQALFVPGYRECRESIREVELKLPVAVCNEFHPGLECRNFFIQQGCEMNPVLLLKDNQSTNKMIQGGRSNSEKSRHVDIRFYFVCIWVQNGEVIVKYVCAKIMVADLLTKPIQGAKFPICAGYWWGVVSKSLESTIMGEWCNEN